MKRNLLKTLLPVFALAGATASAEVLTQATVVQGDNSNCYTMYGSGKMYFEGDRLVIDTIGNGPVASFRLASIDKLLLSNFESSVSGTEFIVANKMAVAPSVAEDVIFVTGAGGDFAFRVYDSAGHVVSLGNSADGQPIDVRAYQQGVYFLKINGNILKFVKL